MSTDLAFIEARHVLGLLNSDDLPAVAADLLASGHQSDAAVELAGLVGPANADAWPLLDRLLAETGRPRMSKEEALRQYARDISLAIVNKEMAPIDGANYIWQALRKNYLPEFHEFDPFVYAASEVENRPGDRRFFEKAILEEAKRWVRQD